MFILIQQYLDRRDAILMGLKALYGLEALNYMDYKEVVSKTLICDMIKRNESDVGDFVFEILAKKSVQIPLFILF